VGNMYATPASAAIDLSIGGEAKLTATMSDACATAASNSTVVAVYNNLTTDLTDLDGGGAVEGEDLEDAVNALNGGSVDFATGDTANAVKFQLDPCSGNKVDDPTLGFSKELSIGAAGTLANGLGVSFSDTLDLTNTDAKHGNFSLTLDGAFGSLLFKDAAKSAVEAVLISENDFTVTGDDLGGHNTGTDGSGGTGILWTAPSMGNLDLYVSWAPNSTDTGMDDAPYQDTFGFGAVFNADMLSVAAGYEAASATAGHAGVCTATAATDVDANVQARTLVDGIFGGEYCGDQTLTYIGASMSAGDIALSAGYSILDTEEADLTVLSINAGTTVGAYDLSVGYRQNTKDYEYVVQDTQDVVKVGLSTALGDGVDLGLDFSSSNVDIAAESLGNGKTSNYHAEASLTVGF